MLSLARRLEPLKVGHPVGLLSENRPEWGLAYLAILTCGGMVVPIDPQLKDDELRGLIAESKIDRLLVSTRFGERAKRVAKTLTTSIEIINLESVTDDNDDEFCVDSGDHPDRPAVMIFTSGTTGSAKKVILTHGNLLSNIEGIMARLPLATDDCYLSVLPLHHTFEATCGLLVPLLQGVAVYYVSEINSREILKGIAKHQITRFISVPLLFEKMYHGILNGIRKAALPKRAAFEAALLITKGIYYLFHVNVGHTLFRPFWKRAGLHTIRLMVSGGAPLPLEIARNFNLMGFHFVEGYGLTEAAPVVSVNPPWRVKFGSVGPPLDNVEVRIDSPDERGVGEVLVRGAMVTPGYDGNPEETAKLLANGWLHSGDMGRLDGDGYLYIVGRKKSLIVTAAGKNVYPEEIEAALMASPLIIEALAYGRRNVAGREEVAVMIYPDFERLQMMLGKPQPDMTDDEIKSAVDPEIREISSRMADFKRIKHVSYVWRELEKTSTRKIKRHLYNNGSRNENNSADNDRP